MRKISFLTGIGLLMIWTAKAQAPITGFAPPTAALQHEREKQFDAVMDRHQIDLTIKHFSAFPHHLGSAGSKAIADSTLNRFRAYGWQAELDVYHVLFPVPKVRRLEMLQPSKFKATLQEPALKEDGASRQRGQLPPYNAWSADGDVTGELVFVNYGLPEDYEILSRLGISVEGKIVIARYGRSWRGIKPKVAQEHGAIGCIIYADPADDGYAAGDVYPKGPFKNAYGVQRGSVMDMPVYPGDPLTPGRGAKKDVERLRREEAENLLKIPVLPIGYHDAKPILEALEGPVVPSGWQGGLPFTYHVGPGPARIRLQVECQWDIVPCYNVVARIPGTDYPDEWVIRGNHHDAWNNGASDPVSGVAALTEEARAIGALLRTGWKPKRTIVYCVWDGEEPGLLGSTEFVEARLQELRTKAVAYINTDGNSRGYLGAGGSAALQTLMQEVARDVRDPQTGVPVLERLRARKILAASGPAARKKAMAEETLTLYPLGSGSDYSPFLQHAGVPSLNLGYGGEGSGGEYHSVYDSYEHYSRFKDPGFYYGVTLAQTVGRAVLRLADADLLPFRFSHLLDAVRQYQEEVQALLAEKREASAIDARMRAMNVYLLATDTAKKMAPPRVPPPVPYLDFSPLQNALVALKNSVDSLEAGAKAALQLSKDRQAQLNRALATAEQQLMLTEGLPRRPWYRHAIYAPGFYTGYGVKTMPWIREAIEQDQFAEAQEGISAAAAAVSRLATHLNQAAKAIR